MKKGQRIPLEQRFWAKVKKTEACWLWTAFASPDGYGVVRVEGKNVRAHRMSWVMANGSIPDDLCVCHHCDTPLCVRPEHLFLGTNKENTHDAMSKGRFWQHKALTHSWPGENNPRAKMTYAQAEWVRRVVASGISQGDAGWLLSVGQAHISKIVRGEIWSHA